MFNLNELIPIGKIIGPHGIRGQMRLHSYSGNFSSLSHVSLVSLKASDGTIRDFALKSAQAHNGRFIITLADCNDPDQVEPLVGNEVCIRRCNLPELEDDEYYWCDLIGLEVFTDEGTLLGTVSEIFETGSNDIYIVRNDDREFLIPAIGDVIKSIDTSKGRIVITPLDGLLDL